jgi:hypothetical protein
MIYSNPASREIWAGFSDEERAEGWSAYAALNAALVASGELIISEALDDPSLGKRVSVSEGRAMVSDGPFAEAKEVLAGFILVECESTDRALEIAARIPEAELGLVEVRPVMSLGRTET